MTKLESFIEDVCFTHIDLKAELEKSEYTVK